MTWTFTAVNNSDRKERMTCTLDDATSQKVIEAVLSIISKVGKVEQ